MQLLGLERAPAERGGGNRDRLAGRLHADVKIGLDVDPHAVAGDQGALAPALHLAAGADFVDLDGPLWLADDWPGGVSDDRGMLVPPAPGFWGQSR